MNKLDSENGKGKEISFIKRSFQNNQKDLHKCKSLNYILIFTKK